jgi:8-oxo-dGTP diphosphatase
MGRVTPIVGTLAYVRSPDGAHVLLVHRNARPDDEHLGKWNGLGGKVERDEDVLTSLRRELQEEACIEITSCTLRGTVLWPGFGKNGEDWLGFVFLVDGFTGDVPDHNVEGDLEWIPVARLLLACDDDEGVRDAAALPMWEGDRLFLPLVFDGDPRPFHGLMPYEHGRPTAWSYARM